MPNLPSFFSSAMVLIESKRYRRVGAVKLVQRYLLQPEPSQAAFADLAEVPFLPSASQRLGPGRIRPLVAMTRSSGHAERPGDQVSLTAGRKSRRYR